MIKQLMMSPAMALHHWPFNKMTISNVLSQTGFTTLGGLYDQYQEDLINHLMALEDKYLTPAYRQRDEDVDAVWAEFGDYIREFVPPAEYDDEIERLLPLIVATRQSEASARSRPFRDAVARRKAQALH